MSGMIGGAGSRSGLIGSTELDYEEGTWTLVDNASNITFTNVVQENSYIKIGKMVFVSFRLVGGTILQNDTYQILDGLPYPAVRAHSAPKIASHGTPYRMEIQLYQGQLQKVIWTGYNNGGNVLAQTYGDYSFNLVYETSS